MTNHTPKHHSTSSNPTGTLWASKSEPASHQHLRYDDEVDSLLSSLETAQAWSLPSDIWWYIVALFSKPLLSPLIRSSNSSARPPQQWIGEELSVPSLIAHVVRIPGVTCKNGPVKCEMLCVFIRFDCLSNHKRHQVLFGEQLTILRLCLSTNIVTPTVNTVILRENTTCMITYTARTDLLKSLFGWGALSNIVLSPAFGFSISV